MCIALAALEAKVHVTGPAGDRAIPFADYHRLPGDEPWRDNNLAPGELVTGIDIVAAQIQIAAGATLPQLGLTQDAITKRGFAIQCRITTEDASQGFQPDTGKIEVYRSAGGNGVRLDASSGFAGAQITVCGLPPLREASFAEYWCV